MNESEFLALFYGPTLLWYGPIYGLFGVLAVIGNSLMIWIALTTPSIRSVSSNWFYISIGVSEFVSGLNSSLLSGTAYFCGRDQSCPILVTVTAVLTFAAVESAFGKFACLILLHKVFPAFITIIRYHMVTALPSDTSKFKRYIISSQSIILLISCAWSYVIVLSSVVVIFDGFGEDMMGCFSARRFTSFWLYLTYMTGGSYAICSYFTTYYFYHKLQKFVVGSMSTVGANSSVGRSQLKERNETISVMRMVKLATLIPMIAQSPVFALDGSQWFLPVDLVPMWLRRIFMACFGIPPMTSPWITMLTLGPFKREIKRRFGFVYLKPSAVSVVSVTAGQ